MRRRSWNSFVRTAIVLTAIPLVTTGRAADFEPIQATTELGVTITPSDIFDSFEESLTFWPAVRRHVNSGQLEGADPALCVEAEAFIGQVQDQLHDRLMGSDQSQALDVIQYVTWNLRRAHFYRELRTTVGSGNAAPQLRRAIYQQFALDAREGRTFDVDRLKFALEPELKALALPIDREVHARELLGSIAICTNAMEQTETGHILRVAETSLEGRPCADLVRRIVSAADWALIIKETGTPPRREHFIAAWQELHPAAVTRVAAQ
jgi:hypothetical protein